MNIPTNLKYTKRDEWIRQEGEFGYIGITDYAQHELGQIIYADIDPDLVGETLEAEEEFGAVEANKTSEPLMMPVGGEVVEINELVTQEETGKIINEDPYGQGWMIKIKVTDMAEMDDLLDAAAYEEKIK